MAKTLGVIGLGRMGYRTVQAGRDAGLELVAILDSAETPWGLEQDPDLKPVLFSQMDDFLAAKPDVAAISTTADSHAVLFHLLADAGIKTMLMEKPLACSVEDALSIRDRAEAEGLHILVNHNHRCWGELQKIRALDGDPRLGALKSFIIAQGAGGLGNLGTHYFDLANWMFDAEPLQVAAFGTTPEAANPRGAHFQDIGGAVIVSYPGQKRLLMEIGDDVGVIGGYEFRFERGRVLMPFTSEPPKVFVRNAETQDMPKHFYGAALEELPWDDFIPGDVVRHTRDVFCNLLDGSSENGATLHQASVALETMIGARLSIETGTVRTLPLDETARKTRYQLA